MVAVAELVGFQKLQTDIAIFVWTMEYPSESPYGVAGRIWYMRVKMVGK